jgi:hypothetical protein
LAAWLEMLRWTLFNSSASDTTCTHVQLLNNSTFKDCILLTSNDVVSFNGHVAESNIELNTEALLNIEPLGSRIVGGKNKEV